MISTEWEWIKKHRTVHIEALPFFLFLYLLIYIFYYYFIQFFFSPSLIWGGTQLLLFLFCTIFSFFVYRYTILRFAPFFFCCWVIQQLGRERWSNNDSRFNAKISLFFFLLLHRLISFCVRENFIRVSFYCVWLFFYVCVLHEIYFFFPIWLNKSAFCIEREKIDKRQHLTEKFIIILWVFFSREVNWLMLSYLMPCMKGKKILELFFSLLFLFLPWTRDDIWVWKKIHSIILRIHKLFSGIHT